MNGPPLPRDGTLNPHDIVEKSCKTIQKEVVRKKTRATSSLFQLKD